MREYHRRRSLIFHVVYIQEPSAAAATGFRETEIEVGVIRRVRSVGELLPSRGADVTMVRSLRTGAPLVVGAGVEVDVRTGAGTGARAEVVLILFRRGARRVRVSLPPRREVEERRRGAEGRRAAAAAEILVEEAVQRETDGLEREEVSRMSLSEGETVSYGFIEESAAVTAQRHRRRIVELGGGAPHQKSIRAANSGQAWWGSRILAAGWKKKERWRRGILVSFFRSFVFMGFASGERRRIERERERVEEEKDGC